MPIADQQDSQNTAKPIEAPPRPSPSPIKLFISYAHRDEEFRLELDDHLSNLQRQQIILGWHDRQIMPGQEWADQIYNELNDAQIILLLISARFMASDYCYAKEMVRAIERHDAAEAVVIPIILSACDWQGAPFGKLQALPKDAKPIKNWNDRDEAWLDVVRGLRREIDRLSRPESTVENSSISDSPPAVAVPPGNQQTNRPVAELDFKSKQRLIDALLGCACLQTPQSLDRVVLELPDNIRSRIKRSQNPRHDVLSIMNTCLEFQDGLESFMEIVEGFEGKLLRWQEELLIGEIERGLNSIDPPSHLNRLYLRCNRGPQCNSFETAFDLHRESMARRPMVCLVHGDESECHDMILDRIQSEILPGLLEVSVNNCVWSNPPSPKDSADKFWLALGRRFLDRRFNTLAESQEQILKELDRLNRPLLVRLQWYSEQFEPARTNGLANFMQFWESWPPLPENRMVICALSLVYSDTKDALSRLAFWQKSSAGRLKEWVKEYEKGKQPAPGFSLSVLPELAPVEHHEAKRWCDYLDPERREHVKDQIIGFFKGRDNRPIDMRTLVKELRKFLAETTPSALSHNRS